MLHPYSGLPDRQFWRKAIAGHSWRDVEFVERSKFTIARSDKIVTAGSCFAQNLTRYLQAAGCDILVTEPAHPLLSAEMAKELHYGQYPARYGNIYTARQLLQLFEEAVGAREVIEDFVQEEGAVYDLLRPGITPNGFSCLKEAQADRHFHIQCVKKMFETADVFVFTLGLTEAWENYRRNFVYPVCPGTVKGRFDPDTHKFVNYSFNEVLSDLTHFVTELKALNEGIKIIFTVSPVALNATYEKQNVLLASAYSKAVLRAVCGEIQQRFTFVEYFPSFEIVSSVCSFGQYLDESLRGVSERGVKHVMTCFFKTYLNDLEGAPAARPATVESDTSHLQLSEMLHEAECEEMFNDPSYRERKE